MGPGWTLDLAVSDGRGGPSCSRASGAEPLAQLPGLVPGLFPPPRPASRPVWIRLDLTPPPGTGADAGAGVVELVQQAFAARVLTPLGLDPGLPVALLRAPAGWRLWLDRTLLASAAAQPLAAAMMEAWGCTMRRLESGAGGLPGRVYQLAALLILGRHRDAPALELAALGLTRSLLTDLQPASATAEAPRLVLVAGRPHLLASALLLVALAQQHQLLATDLASEVRRGLTAWLLDRLPRLTPTASAPVLLALAGLSRQGLAPAGWEPCLLDRLQPLISRSGGAGAARCWYLFALLLLAESAGVSSVSTDLGLSSGEILALADLPPDPAALEIGSGLRTVLASRLMAIRGDNPHLRPSPELLSATARIVCSRQCDPQRALDAADPQGLLGAFLTPGCLRLSPWAQLAPLLALVELQHIDADGEVGR